MSANVEANRTKPHGAPRELRAGEAQPNHLYLQVARTLKEEIVAGLYPIGTQLPTEDALCARFNVSRYTVREALRRLREDNLVTSRQGAGTMVAPRHTTSSYAQDVMSIDDMVSWSAGRRFAIDAIEMVTLDERLATRTGLGAGEEWLAVSGFGHMEGVKAPVCAAEYYINKKFAAVGRLLPRHTRPIFPLIEDMFGQKIVEVRQDIGATLVSAPMAAPLKVRQGSAALEMRRWFKSNSGDIAQMTISTHPAARFSHSMTLRRVRT